LARLTSLPIKVYVIFFFILLCGKKEYFAKSGISSGSFIPSLMRFCVELQKRLMINLIRFGRINPSLFSIYP
jgi:hypothetical protein